MHGSEVVLASVLGAVADIAGVAGTTLTDVLRVGQGYRKLTAWGAVEDTLRLTVIAGAGGKLVRYAAAAASLGGPQSCVLSGAAKLLRMAGHRFNQALTFDAIEGFLGIPRGWASLPSYVPGGLINAGNFMRELGISYGRVAVGSLDDVIRATKTLYEPFRPVMFGFKYANGEGHAMVAFRDYLGRLHFADQLARD